MTRRPALFLLLLALAGCAEEGGSFGGASSSLKRYVFDDPSSGCQARRLRDAGPVDGVRWTGACVHGFASGEGTMVWRRGDETVETDRGSFRNGILDGEGSREWADGSRYRGQWRAGRIEGQGSLLSASGQRYDGDWHDGKRDGQGVQTWPSGNHYEGGWSGDERDGRGKFTWPDGSYFEGRWDDGKPVSKGSLFVDSNGARYLNWDYHE